jgi:hypothetical protein
VFLVSVFDPAIAQRCPDPLLPVRESVRGDSQKGKPKGQTASSQVATGFGGSGQWPAGEGANGELRQSISAKWSKGSSGPAGDEYMNMVVEAEPVGLGKILGSDIVGPLAASDWKFPQQQQVHENKIIVEPYVKSRRAQTSDDDETWIPAEVTPTLNSFDVGDTRATTAIVEPMLLDGRRVDDVRIYEPPVQTLQARMGTGGNNVPVVGINEPVAYSIREDAKANTFSATELDRSNALSALRPSPQSHHAQMFITQPMAVRRLTPLECERLMGWPDDHTRWKADGTEQADTHRYKQCGNGVASPVAQWVAEHMRRINEIQ